MNNMEQNYCMVNIETNVCDNVCIWDGNPQTWTPPSNYLMLIQDVTPAKVWQFKDGAYELTVKVGVGAIGFTWDGDYLITDEPQPTQPTSINTQEL